MGKHKTRKIDSPTEPLYRWRPLELKFRELKCRKTGQKLWAQYYVCGFPHDSLWPGSPWALNGTLELCDEFMALAKLGAMTSGRGNTWQDFLDLLKGWGYGYKHKPSPIQYLGTGASDAGEIRRVCERSEIFCRDRADNAGELLIKPARVPESDKKEEKLESLPSRLDGEKVKTHKTVYGRNLNEYRNRLGFSMKQFAEAVKISERSVKSYIIEGKDPSAKTKNKIYNYLTQQLKIKIRALDLEEIKPVIEQYHL